MGAGANVNAIFGIATMVIAVPTGVKVFDWLFTMFRGRIRFEPPMKFTIGFMCLFVIGGMSGVLLAIPPINYSTHNTTFLVAHFHNMIIPGVLFGYLAGYMYWFPKAFGFQLDRKWGSRSFWFWLVGFLLAFMPLYALGLMGMPRRMETYGNPEWQPLLIVAFIGACLILLGIVSLVMQLWVSIKQRDALKDTTGDPWDGRTLEWSIPSPPPVWNFDSVPVVTARDAFHESKITGVVLSVAPEEEPLLIPRNSTVGPIIGAAGFCVGFGAVWFIWWLMFAGLALAIAAIIGRSFFDDTEVEVFPGEGAESI